MRHEDDGALQFGPDPEQVVLHRSAGEGVQRAERFVHQKHRRFDGQRAGDGDPLTHAAGKIFREAITEAFERELVEEPFHRRGDPVGALDLEAEGDVFEDGHPGEERVLLEDHRALGAGRSHRLAEGFDRALVGRDEAGDDVEQRRLAAARRPEQADEFARRDVEVDVFQCADGLRELFAHAADMHRRLRHFRSRGASAAADR